MTENATSLAYLIASVLFILALKGLSSPESARRGNKMAIVGMAIAIVTTLLAQGVQNYVLIIGAIAVGGTIGGVIARRIAMTSMPELVAAMHSLVGLAAVLIAVAAYLDPAEYGIAVTNGSISTISLIEMVVGAFIGAITFTGSIIAFGKLQGSISSAPLAFPGQHFLNAALGVGMVVFSVQFCMQQSLGLFLLVIGIALALGVLLIVPIGGADMPVVVSMLNSYSGWAAAGIGFTLGNNLLIITGALVGSSGAILSYIMCKAMNRSIWNVLFGGFGTADGGGSPAQQAANKGAKAGSPEDAAFLMKNSRNVIIVPGYGMAVGRAQHAVKEMTDLLTEAGVHVRFAIHPVAGRMPGHMNVLLAEAEVPYDMVFELDEINREFRDTDVAIVIGANDVVNPVARTDPSSPIYGMPILDADKAKTVMVVKRSLSPGYAGIDNPLFYEDNTLMLFGDAKHIAEQIVKAL